MGRIVFKSWQALVFCQTAIDVAAELSARFMESGWGQVKSIRVATYKKAVEEAGGEGCYQPDSRAGRTHSLPYCVAAALLDGGVSFDSFGGEMARSEKMKALIGKVVLGADDVMSDAFPEKAPCGITVEYEDRPPLALHRDYPRGDPHQPLDDNELCAKAAAHLSPLIPAYEANALIKRLWEVEAEDTLGWLMDPLKQGVQNA